MAQLVNETTKLWRWNMILPVELRTKGTVTATNVEGRIFGTAPSTLINFTPVISNASPPSLDVTFGLAAGNVGASCEWRATITIDAEL